MTPYDAAMVGVILAGMVWGAFKGVTWQVASLASLIVGYGASHALSRSLHPTFQASQSSRDYWRCLQFTSRSLEASSWSHG